MSQITNKLGNETSPYLLQHADNPVAWYPWGEEALQRAHNENRPILLSIGYSACHWCHVMAHESFENPATAELMNQLFINIKVDREERPDLDKIYQTAHHLLTQRHGGWPLTMFLTPDDHIPFFGGTYFPPEPRYNMPGFPEILKRVAEFYQTHRDDIEQQNASVRRFFEQREGKSEAHLDMSVADKALQELAESYDHNHAGFGKAPKFPHPTNLEYLLYFGMRQPSDMPQHMLTATLDAMARGGLYDQLGGGFCRYSVDDEWMIPHFEKMLYDNGPLLTLYAQTSRVFDNPFYARIAHDTANWVMREMQSDSGGYYSTLDADSEGEEGKFYVWTPDEINSLLTPEQYAVLARHFGLDRKPNFEGHYHLHTFTPLPEIADDSSIELSRAEQLLAEAKAILFEAREQRIRPGRDEKILTAWNGLMIKGMATAGHLLQEPDYIASAIRAVDDIRTTMWVDGRLLATAKDGHAHLMAYLDDYVFLIDGLLALLQARWRDEDLLFAIQLMDVVLEQFQDKDAGGFYFTANDHEQLIHRPKVYADEAIPSGNGIAARVLLELGQLTGETRYQTAAEACLNAAWRSLQDYPSGHCTTLLALTEFLQPGRHLVLRGEQAELQAWLNICDKHFALQQHVYVIPAESSKLPGLLAERTSTAPVTAWLCAGHQCQPPIADLQEFTRQLNDIAAAE